MSASEDDLNDLMQEINVAFFEGDNKMGSKYQGILKGERGGNNLNKEISFDLFLYFLAFDRELVLKNKSDKKLIENFFEKIQENSDREIIEKDRKALINNATQIYKNYIKYEDFLENKHKKENKLSEKYKGDIFSYETNGKKLTYDKSFLFRKSLQMKKIKLANHNPNQFRLNLLYTNVLERLYEIKDIGKTINGVIPNELFDNIETLLNNDIKNEKDKDKKDELEKILKKLNDLPKNKDKKHTMTINKENEKIISYLIKKSREKRLDEAFENIKGLNSSF